MPAAESEKPLVARGLQVDIGDRELVGDLELSLAPGEFVALLGRNGCGKTLTLETLSGLRPATRGDIRYFGRPANDWSRPDLARRLSLLPQEQEDLFPSTVLEEALIGRHPHIGRWRWESKEDQAVAVAELDRLGLAELTERNVATLSGGERRRLAIAQTLIQRPDVYLLDEPTNHLDPRHQLRVLEIVREEAARGATALVSLHDANLAERFADRCLLLYGDGEWELGRTASVLDGDRLGRLYGTPIVAVPWRGRRLFTPDESPVGPTD
ncbi:MAG: ABC transporter ATP-binding protein [Gammaproteobacteria bacterium]